VVTFIFDVSHWPVWSSKTSIQPLPNPLHNFLTCYTLTLPSQYTPTNQWWILNRKTYFTPKHWTALQIYLQDQVLNITARANQLIPWRLSQWATRAICWMLPTLQVPFPYIELNSWLRKLQARELYLLSMHHPF
jgi:hypothetical protein